MTTAPASSTRRSAVPLRVGLVIAALLGVGDVVNAFTQLGENAADPFGWTAAVAAVATLGLIPFAWRGSAAAGWIVAVVRVLSSLLGLPAFFVPGVPAPFVVAAAVGILLAVLSAVLILTRRRA